jgi:hypothetical protein
MRGLPAGSAGLPRRGFWPLLAMTKEECGGQGAFSLGFRAYAPRCPCKPQRGAGCPALSSRSERSVLPFSLAVPGTRFLH